MIEIKDKSLCCGCSACVQRCPKQCITMHEDEEGFLYPKVDTATCIDCGLCEKVCPIINQAVPSEPLKVYAAKNKDLQKRELSSSGGHFIALAERVIEKGGVVFGVVFDENWEAHHVAATTLAELQPMMRSKYMQSRVENTFAEAEKYLNEGREVMYTGTPCQIAALKLFLRKEYSNLLTVDVICHGVPSPGVWRKYLQEEINLSARSAANGENTVLNHSLKSMPVITGVSFREKSRSGYEWGKFGFVLWGKSPSKGDKNSVLSSNSLHDNPFMKGFLRDIYLRPSCYNCPSKGGKSKSDMTIADYWGIGRVMPDFHSPEGVSLAILHTEKSVAAFSECNVECRESNMTDAIAGNISYYKSVAEPSKRAQFYKEYIGKSDVSVISLINEVTKVSFLLRAKRFAKRTIRFAVRRCLFINKTSQK